MKITEVVEGILRKKGWSLYDRQDPIQKLPVSGETPLFKVNEVELRYLFQEIEQQLMKEEEWKRRSSDGSQENTSQIG